MSSGHNRSPNTQRRTPTQHNPACKIMTFCLDVLHRIVESAFLIDWVSSTNPNPGLVFSARHGHGSTAAAATKPHCGDGHLHCRSTRAGAASVAAAHVCHALKTTPHPPRVAGFFERQLPHADAAGAGGGDRRVCGRPKRAKGTHCFTSLSALSFFLVFFFFFFLFLGCFSVVSSAVVFGGQELLFLRELLLDGKFQDAEAFLAVRWRAVSACCRRWLRPLVPTHSLLCRVNSAAPRAAPRRRVRCGCTEPDVFCAPSAVFGAVARTRRHAVARRVPHAGPQSVGAFVHQTGLQRARVLFNAAAVDGPPGLPGVDALPRPHAVL